MRRGKRIAALEMEVDALKAEIRILQPLVQRVAQLEWSAGAQQRREDHETIRHAMTPPEFRA